MDQKEEFDISQIMQVFSKQAPPATLAVEVEQQEVPSDTIRLDEIHKAVAAAQVEGAVKIEEDLEKTRAFTPPDLEQTQAFTLPDTEAWEPELEEPLDDMPIPEPVIHRPKSRLAELREKLVAGPEKRYYELSSQGVGKLQLSVAVNALILLLTLGLTVLFALGIIPAGRLRLLVFVQFLAMMLSAMLGSNRLIEGFTSLIKGRFTPDTLLFFTFLVCCVDSVLCLKQLRLSVCSVFCLQTTMALWAAYNRRNTEMGQMDTLRRATNLSGLACVEEDYEGMTGFRICRGEVEHFMDNYQEVSGPDRLH